ncbi:cysteine desulfurase family protein [Paenibacillus provencensis]|uniref:Cysteine desulfurase family protein n=1 Tax=Paenibacillus provencensis TaxID=441151 RepID=A0ABW3PPV7_9BACL|nr:cysteine desulfurase family protein [Paenibacillus sp. MER 78]MCM3126230.1 cysteine desulfurase [Paenibacillus sp. MER 78]
MLYFDYAASAPPYEDVIRTVSEVMKLHYGNASSIHAYGENAERLLNKSRSVCAEALNVKPDEIIFTSGATESNNLALKGAALRYRSRGRHIITTRTEHASVYESIKFLSEIGYDITYVPVDAMGRVKTEDVLNAICEETILVSLMHVNNETGAVHPVVEIGQALKRKHPKIVFHVDGVQAYGKIPVQLAGSGIDLYSISGHKIRGPKGVGLLYIRSGLELTPLMSGGSQEQGRRAGTENIPLIVGMSKAMRLARERQPELKARLERLQILLLEEISQHPEWVLNSSEEGAPHIVHFSYPGMKAEVMLHTLEQLDIIVSTQSACSSKQAIPSRVLLGMGKSEAIADSGIRISLGDQHTEKDILQLIQAMRQMKERLASFEGWNS